MASTSNALIGRTGWLLRQVGKQVWLRTVLFSVAAVAVAVVAAIISPYLPYQPDLTLASGSVQSLLNIIASSMLAVTTFSLSIAVSAYASATSNATPRSTKLLLSDPVAQNALSTFVGSFLFAIVGIIGLSAGVYDARGRVLLFFSTLVVLVLITLALLRWIDALGRFGRVGDTIHRVERATIEALREAGARPGLGALPQRSAGPGAIPIRHERTGPITHIDCGALQEIAEDNDLRVYLQLLPGSVVHPNRTLLYVEPSPGDAAREELRDCFSIDRNRAFDHDPRFGLVVLSEIASRALSPAVNDPGTAIEVLGAALRALIEYGAALRGAEQPCYDRVFAPRLAADDLFAMLFDPIVRDGAAMFEVLARVVHCVAALRDSDPAVMGEAAQSIAGHALAYGEERLAMPWERAALAAIAAEQGFAAQ
ncbi:DUF2254 domain-containing protein [Sphingomonas japonica]|uniref:Membrane protein n=1 Tax=Sphingomonas japonica TaxID=511662 RepID=A0ABX0TXV7_9SPHN|nr:DUF2254 domain-containing protein [Sphingomonas japonica]NIJ22690.1 putative membrane protein [Sphingomonas japonica]